METIDTLTSETFYNMHKYSQLILDLVSEVENDLQAIERGEQDFPTEAWGYEIDLLLEIYNPELKDDIEMLNRLKDVLYGKEIVDNFFNQMEKEVHQNNVNLNL